MSKPVALCRSAIELAEAVEGSDGRWLVNNGDAMEMLIEGLHVVKGKSQEVRCVIDLTTMKPARATISALYNHEALIGHWSDIVIDPARGILQTLRLTRPTNDIEGRVLAEAVMVGAHLRAKVPWQASVGVKPSGSGSWECIAPGETVQVNGRTFSGDGDLPLYVLRGGELFETSVCEFGADGRTGQIAAKRQEPTPTTTKESPMSRIKIAASLSKGKPAALCAAILALCADESVPDAEIGPKVTAMEMDDLKARLQAAEDDGKKKDEEIAALKAKAVAKATDEPADDKKDEPKKDDAKAKAAASASNKGVTFSEKHDEPVVAEAPTSRVAAQAAVRAKNKDLKGEAVVRAAIKQFKNYHDLPFQD